MPARHRKPPATYRGPAARKNSEKCLCWLMPMARHSKTRTTRAPGRAQLSIKSSVLSQCLSGVTNKWTNTSDPDSVLERVAQCKQPSLSHPYKQDTAYGFSHHLSIRFPFSRNNPPPNHQGLTIYPEPGLPEKQQEESFNFCPVAAFSVLMEQEHTTHFIIRVRVTDKAIGLCTWKECAGCGEMVLKGRRVLYGLEKALGEQGYGRGSCTCQWESAQELGKCSVSLQALP